MRERMLAGDLYIADDPELAAEAARAGAATGTTRAGPDRPVRAQLLSELLGAIGEGTEIRPPFHCDYGYQTHDRRPDVRELRSGLPRRRRRHHRRRRADRPERAAADAHPPGRARARGGTSGRRPQPITIGDNVWLGGGVIVCPGVTIGENTVVGAGSVVIRDLPAERRRRRQPRPGHPPPRRLRTPDSGNMGAMPEPTAAPAADAWGVQQDWVDAYDQPHRVPDETVALLREVIGTPPDDLEEWAPVVTRPGRRLGLGPVEVECEDGTRRTVGDDLPQDFPLGYHRLHTAAGRTRSLIVSPGRCWLPDRRLWGWTVQLYAARSSESWGIGDLGDLGTLRSWTESLGGGFVLVNPLHAVAPTLPQETSPYLPATRRFRNPVYLRVPTCPGRWCPATSRRPGSSTAATWSTGTRCGRSSATCCGAPSARPAARTTRRSPRGARPAAAWRSSRPGAPWPSSTAPTGARGRRGCAARTSRTCGRTPPSGPTGCRSTPGCSGSSTSSCVAPAATCWCSRTCRSGCPAAAPTPGRGPTRWRTASRWAPRRTCSTPPARTGAPPRWCRGGCGRPATRRSSSRCARPSPAPEGCGSTT